MKGACKEEDYNGKKMKVHIEHCVGQPSKKKRPNVLGLTEKTGAKKQKK